MDEAYIFGEKLEKCSQTLKYSEKRGKSEIGWKCIIGFVGMDAHGYSSNTATRKPVSGSWSFTYHPQVPHSKPTSSIMPNLINAILHPSKLFHHQRSLT